MSSLTFGHRGTKSFVPQNVLWYQYSCINFTAKIFPNNLSVLMQGVVCLAKFEYNLDLHDNKTV